MKKLIGFAALSKEDRKAVSSKGAKRLHELSKAYKFTSETAREAGRKAGIASGVARRAKKLTP